MAGYVGILGRRSGGGDGSPCLQTFEEAVAALSPVAWWRLNETSGTTATDSSGNGHHGTYHADTKLANHDGACSDGPKFINLPAAGSQAGVTVPDFSAVSAPNEFTIMFLSLYQNAFTTGVTQATMTPVFKPSEWFIAERQDAIEIGVDNTVSGAYRSYLHNGSPVGTGWNLTFVKFPSASDVVVDFANSGGSNIPLTGTTTGPTGTRRGDQATDLVIGQTGNTMSGGTDPLHGRFLANVAVFSGLLADLDIGDLMSAAANDGWFD